MSNIQTGAERMPHDLSHLGFLAGQIGRLITISTTPVIAGDSFEMDAVGALRLSPLRRGLAIDSTVDRSEERFSRNAETDLVCRLLPEKKNSPALHTIRQVALGERRVEDVLGFSPLEMLRRLLSREH